MPDRIFVNDLCLHAHHGVFPEENRLGQKFFVDIECGADFTACAADDDYRKAICYGALCDIAAETSASDTFRLIETLADQIARQILARHADVTDIVVRIRKPSAPLSQVVGHVGVEVRRDRSSHGDRPLAAAQRLGEPVPA